MMPGAVCKAVICEDKAQGQLQGLSDSINGFVEEAPEVRIKAAEIVLKYTEQCTAELVNFFESPDR